MTMMVSRYYQTFRELVKKTALVESGLEKVARHERSQRNQVPSRPKRVENKAVSTVVAACETCGKIHCGVSRKGGSSNSGLPCLRRMDFLSLWWCWKSG